jgi:hypothetical protein
VKRESTGSDVRVLALSRDLDDYDIVSTMTLSVAVPHRTTESFRKLIWAAMTTYGFGNSSVDHVLRRYGHLWDRRPDKSSQRDPRIVALRAICEIVDIIASSLEKRYIDVPLGALCAKAVGRQAKIAPGRHLKLTPL